MIGLCGVTGIGLDSTVGAIGVTGVTGAIDILGVIGILDAIGSLDIFGTLTTGRALIGVYADTRVLSGLAVEISAVLLSVMISEYDLCNSPLERGITKLLLKTGILA